MAMKLKTVPSIESEKFFSGVSELPVVIPVVISETFISVVSWSVVLLYVVSGIGNITSFVYNQFQWMHTN